MNDCKCESFDLFLRFKARWVIFIQDIENSSSNGLQTYNVMKPCSSKIHFHIFYKFLSKWKILRKWTFSVVLVLPFIILGGVYSLADVELKRESVWKHRAEYTSSNINRAIWIIMLLLFNRTVVISRTKTKWIAYLA